MQKPIVYFTAILLFSSLSMIFVANAQHSTTNNSISISGNYLSDKGTIYDVKQTNDTVWLVGTPSTINKDVETISNIFSGVLKNNNTELLGKWIDFPLSNNSHNGKIGFNIIMNSNKNTILTKITSNEESSNAYPINTLTKYDPALHTPLKIFVSMENVLVNEARSPTSDILYAGISGQKNNDDPLTATKYFGTRGDGSNITSNLKIGPFSFDNENDFLKVEILGLDKADSRTPFTLVNLRDTLIQLMEPSYNISDLVQAVNVISSISPGLIPGGCNGLVFIDELAFPSEVPRNLTATSSGGYNMEKTYMGTTSPPGCGPPSQYLVKLTITSQN